MNAPVEAIFFDMGGTLRGGRNTSESEQIQGVRRIKRLLSSPDSPEALLETLKQRTQAYRSWSRRTHIELDEIGQWTRWYLPDWPEEFIRDRALQLNQLWRQATRELVMFPEAREVVRELFNRGYRLGVVSNTVSTSEVPELLDAAGISGCFEVIILSSLVGIRKPDPAIFLEATRRMEVEPPDCAYVGNKLDRDVESPRRAGFSFSVILRDPEDQDQESGDPGSAPRYTIDNLSELLEIFPGRSCPPAAPVRYRASLSTMWAKRFPSLAEFSEASRRLGFEMVELNHQLDSGSLLAFDFSRHQVSSIHEPCPAEIPVSELKGRDWLISSLDPGRRAKGMEAVQRTVDLAGAQGVKNIVLHSGSVSTDLTLENQLRDLLLAGQGDTAAYRTLKQSLIEERALLAGACMEAVQESLLALLEYCQPWGIRLGLENRYHYYDIPTLDELGRLLDLAAPDQLGFVYDVGHAQTLERLGFFRAQEWLRRFKARIIGVHLHDVRGVTDHLAPGQGEVDFGELAPYLPEDAFRTLEVSPVNSVEAIKRGMQILVDQACIQIA